MADKKEYAPRHNTPVGTLVHPHLNKPDNKSFDGKPPIPKWKSGLSLTRELADPIIAGIMEDAKFGMLAAEAIRDAAIVKAKAAGKKPQKDPAKADMRVPYDLLCDEAGVETGMVLFKFSSGVSYKDKTGAEKPIVPKVFDAKGRELTRDVKNLVEGKVVVVKKGTLPEIWSGSKGRISYAHFPYYNAATNEYGVSLRLEAAKIIELRSGGSAGAGAFGFGDEEDGFEADDTATDESGTSDTPAADLPTDADF